MELGVVVEVWSSTVQQWLPAVIQHVKGQTVTVEFREQGHIYFKDCHVQSASLRLPPSEVQVGLPEAHHHWWYWQAYRTWVPYPLEDVKIIERAYTAQLKRVDLDHQRAIVFRFDGALGDPRPHQVRIGQEERHREVRRMPVPADPDTYPPSRTLRALQFAELTAMDATSGHSSRLTASEKEKGALDTNQQLSSMKRTMREQLQHCCPDGGWIVLLQASGSPMTEEEDGSSPTAEDDPGLFPAKYVAVKFGGSAFHKPNVVIGPDGDVHIKAVTEPLPNFNRYCRAYLSPQQLPSTGEMVDVVRKFTSSQGWFCTEVNGALAMDSSELARLGMYIRHLKYTICTRGQSGWQYLIRGQDTSAIELREMQRLKTFYIPSFLSTSKNASKASKSSVMYVIAASQAIGLNVVGGLTDFAEEEEVLLPCYTMFELLGIDTRGHQTIVKLRVLPHNGFKSTRGPSSPDTTTSASAPRACMECLWEVDIFQGPHPSSPLITTWSEGTIVLVDGCREGFMRGTRLTPAGQACEAGWFRCQNLCGKAQVRKIKQGVVDAKTNMYAKGRW